MSKLDGAKHLAVYFVNTIKHSVSVLKAYNAEHGSVVIEASWNTHMTILENYLHARCLQVLTLTNLQCTILVDAIQTSLCFDNYSRVSVSHEMYHIRKL